MSISGSSSMVLCCLTAVEYFIFYTDLHNVDEDLTAIINYGGGWAHTTRAGVACRSMDNPPDLLDLVASM